MTPRQPMHMPIMLNALAAYYALDYPDMPTLTHYMSLTLWLVISRSHA